MWFMVYDMSQICLFVILVQKGLKKNMIQYFYSRHYMVIMLFKWGYFTNYVYSLLLQHSSRTQCKINKYFALLLYERTKLSTFSLLIELPYIPECGRSEINGF